MFDMMKMMGQIKKAQELVKKAQEDLKNISETSESGAGLVKATVNGKKEVISIEINDSIINKKEFSTYSLIGLVFFPTTDSC